MIRTVRHYYGTRDLVVGEVYLIDSGLGGTFNVRYRGVEDDRHVFAVTSPDWTAVTVRYTKAEVIVKVFRNDFVRDTPKRF